MTPEQLQKHIDVLVEKHGERYRNTIEGACKFHDEALLKHGFSEDNPIRGMHDMIDYICDKEEMYALRVKMCPECGEPVGHCGCGPAGVDYREDED